MLGHWVSSSMASCQAATMCVKASALFIRGPRSQPRPPLSRGGTAATSTAVIHTFCLHVRHFVYSIAPPMSLPFGRNLPNGREDSRCRVADPAWRRGLCLTRVAAGKTAPARRCPPSRLDDWIAGFGRPFTAAQRTAWFRAWPSAAFKGGWGKTRRGVATAAGTWGGA